VSEKLGPPGFVLENIGSVSKVTQKKGSAKSNKEEIQQQLHSSLEETSSECFGNTVIGLTVQGKRWAAPL